MIESLWKISGAVCEKPSSFTRTVNEFAVCALDCNGVTTTAAKRTKRRTGKAMRRITKGRATDR